MSKIKTCKLNPEWSDEIEWIFCPHCKKKVYGKTALSTTISWYSEEKKKKKKCVS